MNIKKVDDKPMVIHTKKKPKLHVKGTPETKIKGRNADTNTQGRQGKEQEVRQSVNRENRMYAQYRKTKSEKEAAIKKKPAVPAAVVSVATRTALDEMEGGSEVHDAYMTAGTLAKPYALFIVIL